MVATPGGGNAPFTLPTPMERMLTSVAAAQATVKIGRVLFIADAWWGAGDDPDATFELARELLDALEAAGFSGDSYDLWREARRKEVGQ